MKRVLVAVATVAAVSLCSVSQSASAGIYDIGFHALGYRPGHDFGRGVPLAAPYLYSSYGYGGYGLAVTGCYRRLTWVESIYHGMQQAWVTQCY
jgi:hypothetical protein